MPWLWTLSTVSVGIDEVDLWVQADSAWTRWESVSIPRLLLVPSERLSEFGEEVLSRPVHGGFHSHQDGLNHVRVRCECGAEVSSARLEASGFLRALHVFPPGWFAAQPRITAKSGWVTAGAGHTFPSRGHAQIAACTISIAIAGSTVPGAPD